MVKANQCLLFLLAFILISIQLNCVYSLKCYKTNGPDDNPKAANVNRRGTDDIQNGTDNFRNGTDDNPKGYDDCPSNTTKACRIEVVYTNPITYIRDCSENECEPEPEIEDGGFIKQRSCCGTDGCNLNSPFPTLTIPNANNSCNQVALNMFLSFSLIAFIAFKVKLLF